MITAKPGTNFYKALTYLEPAIGRTRYTWWTSGPVPDGAPAYGVNAPAPDISTIVQGGIFCAGVMNVMLRRVGKRIPTYGNALYDGGTLAYEDYFKGYSLPFNLNRALYMARKTRSGVLIGSPFVGSFNQGHVGIVLPSGYLLQSYDGGGGWPGLNWDVPAATSVQYWTPTYMVMPWNWINYPSDIADWARR